MKDTAHRDPHRDKSLGDPMPFTSLPPGDYFAQAIVKVYEQVKRADGKTIWISDGLHLRPQCAVRVHSRFHARARRRTDQPRDRARDRFRFLQVVGVR